MSKAERLARREAAPALLRLHRALSRLSGVLTVMNTGAHPDDEQSGLLAWLRFGLGHRVVIACSTRGEGGQNALGPERGGLLGLIRTREMEEAAAVLDADIAWLGFGRDDPVHDFGFSKDGGATFARWGRERVVTRMAQAYLRWRPDVVIPTFLDVPGQHGHHRAMTQAAEAAIRVAGADGWTVPYFYLPSWGGGGGTYDDTESPPPATLRIEADAIEPATGASYDEIGEWSRRHHASQGMGRWPVTPQRVWELHRIDGGREARLAEALPATLADLAALAGPASADLAEAAEAVNAARAAFPDRATILTALARADAALERAEVGQDAGFAAAHGHRLTRKRREVAAALFEAAGLVPVVSLPRGPARPGSDVDVTLDQPTPFDATDARAETTGGTAAAQPGVTRLNARVADAALFAEAHDAIGGNGPLPLRIEATIAGRRVRRDFDPEVPVQSLPGNVVGLNPDTFLRHAGGASTFSVTFDRPGVEADAPIGWTMDHDGLTLDIEPPAGFLPGLTTIPLSLNGSPALTAMTASYPHIGPVTLTRPAAIKVLSLDLVLPDARVAYVGSGDGVGRWLQRIGVDATILDTVAPDEDFTAYTTVLIGVVAFGSRPDLAAAVPRLHAFVRGGGHLVTLYQRPDQGWEPDTTPPGRLVVGTPSLRWRVTDPAAPVTILDPGHPLLVGPNRITAADFDRWSKERGLYFASDWDDAYQPLLALNDPGEAPLRGAWLSAPIREGRHTHLALVLHHQLDQLVPGAFRLLANLIQPA